MPPRRPNPLRDISLKFRTNDIEYFRGLVREPGFKINETKIGNSLFLTLLLNKASPELIRVIAELCPDLNYSIKDSNSKNSTCLHDAAACKVSLERVSFLVEHISPLERDDEGKTPLEYVRSQTMLGPLSDNERDFQNALLKPTLEAALTADDSKAMVAISNIIGSDIKRINDTNDSLQALAAASGCLESLKELSYISWPVDGKNTNFDTALHKAIGAINDSNRTTQLAIVKLLLSLNASPNVPNKQNLTPLHLAIKAGELGVVKLLVESELVNLSGYKFRKLQYPIEYSSASGTAQTTEYLSEQASLRQAEQAAIRARQAQATTTAGQRAVFFQAQNAQVLPAAVEQLRVAIS